jgi:FkbM family methyltransferase
MIAKIRGRVANILRRRLGFPDQQLALTRLCRTGFTPKVVFDVGASNGVFADEAWALWPNCLVHCFEPEVEYIQQLEVRAQRDPRLQICKALVGAREEPDKTYYHFLGASSVLATNTDDPKIPLTTSGPERRASVITLDDYCKRHSTFPNLLKIDVQGYELEVLKGTEKYLPSIEVILAEVNYIEVYKDVPLAVEVIHWLQQRGFVLHDICNFMRRPLDQALWQSDMIFAKFDSPLRSAKRWG